MKKILAITLSLLMVLGLCACVNKNADEQQKDNAIKVEKSETEKDNSNAAVEQSSTNNNTAQEKDDMNVSSKGYIINFKDKSIELPCTLADLEEAGISVYSEDLKEKILNSENETFTYVTAIYVEKGSESIEMTVVTGNDSDKGLSNAVVKYINIDKIGEFYKLNGKIHRGSSFKECISILGDRYIVTSERSNSYIGHYIKIKYESEKNSVELSFANDKLGTIEVSANE